MCHSLLGQCPGTEFVLALGQSDGLDSSWGFLQSICILSPARRYPTKTSVKLLSLLPWKFLEFFSPMAGSLSYPDMLWCLAINGCNILALKLDSSVLTWGEIFHVSINYVLEKLRCSWKW